MTTVCPGSRLRLQEAARSRRNRPHDRATVQRDAGHKWSFLLPDGVGNGTVDPGVAMMDRLWRGQVSRHDGGPSNRRQTQAEAAIYLAVVLVQLLPVAFSRAGVIAPKS